ncbi:MAG: GGDEF domain-containing protein [Oscillospiraceae bacterium]
MKKKFLFQTIFFALILFATAAALSFLGYSQSKSYAEKQVKNLLTDSALELVQRYEMGVVRPLAAIADEFSKNGAPTADTIGSCAPLTHSISGLTTLAYMGVDGSLVDTNGAVTDCKDTEYFKRAMEGKPFSLAAKEGLYKNSVLICLPVTKNGETVGAIGGVFDHDIYGEWLRCAQSSWEFSSISLCQGELVGGFLGDGTQLLTTDKADMLFEGSDLSALSESPQASPFKESTANINGVMSYVVYLPTSLEGSVFILAADCAIAEDMAAELTSSIVILLIISCLVALVLLLIFILKEGSVQRLLEEQNSQLEMSEREYRVVADHSNQTLFRFFPESGSVQISEEIAALHGLPRIIENSPELSIKTGLVDSGSADAYLEFFKSINQGKPTFGCDIKCNFSTGTVWYNMEYTMIKNPSGEKYAVISATDITQRKNTELEILQRSLQDSLTGALNRMAFEEQATDILKKCKAKKHAIVMLDLDNFKGINDNFGHIMGDNVLFDTCARLRTVINESDLLGRSGGDEFMLLLNDIAAEGAPPIAKRLQLLVDVVHNEIKPGVITSASVGVSFYPDNGKNFEELYRTADIAVYTAKKDGRNRFVIYSPRLEK